LTLDKVVVDMKGDSLLDKPTWQSAGEVIRLAVYQKFQLQKYQNQSACRVRDGTLSLQMPNTKSTSTSSLISTEWVVEDWSLVHSYLAKEVDVHIDQFIQCPRICASQKPSCHHNKPLALPYSTTITDVQTRSCPYRCSWLRKGRNHDSMFSFTQSWRGQHTTSCASKQFQWSNRKVYVVAIYQRPLLSPTILVHSWSIIYLLSHMNNFQQQYLVTLMTTCKDNDIRFLVSKRFHTVCECPHNRLRLYVGTTIVLISTPWWMSSILFRSWRHIHLYPSV